MLRDVAGKNIPRKHSCGKLLYLHDQLCFVTFIKIIMKTQLREAPNFMAPILPKTPPTQGPWFLTSFHQKTLENTAIQLLQWLRDAISFSFRVNQLHTPLCQNAAFPPELRSVTLSAVQKLFPQYRNSSRSTEFFPQYRSSSHSAETRPAVQKVFPQYRNSSCSAEFLPAVQKSFPQYRNSSHSTETLPTVQKFFPQYRNSSRSTGIRPAVQKFVPQYRHGPTRNGPAHTGPTQKYSSTPLLVLLFTPGSCGKPPSSCGKPL